MAYANILSPIAIKICRWFNVFCLSLTLLVCFDLFILQRVVDKEKIVSIEETHVTFRNIFYARVTKPLENVVLITDNYRVPFRSAAYIYLEQADSVQVIRTRLLNIIEKATIKIAAESKELNQKGGMFSKLMFIPIFFALVSIVGVAMWNNREQLLNATVMNIIMLLLSIIMLRFF